MSGLLDSFKAQISPESVSEAAKMHNESETGIYKAICCLAPALLAGLIEKMEGLFDFEPVFNYLGSCAPEFPEPTGFESKPFSFVFGERLPAVTNAIASFSGVRPSTVLSLAEPVGLLVIGLLGKNIRAQGLNTLDLSRYLVAHKDGIVGYLPAGVGLAIGLAATNWDNPATKARAAARKSGWAWLGLLILGLAAAASCLTR